MREVCRTQLARWRPHPPARPACPAGGRRAFQLEVIDGHVHTDLAHRYEPEICTMYSVR